MTTPTTLPTYEDFLPHVGTGFGISSEGEDDVLTLTKVEPGRASPIDGQTAFSLSFTGARNDAMFHSHTFDLTHEVLPPMWILISPTGRNEDGTFNYEAVFN